MTPQEKYELLTAENKEIVTRQIDVLVDDQQVGTTEEEIRRRLREIAMSLTEEQCAKLLKELTKIRAGE